MFGGIISKMVSREDKLLYVINELSKSQNFDGRLKLMKTMFFLEHLDFENDKLTPEHLFSDSQFIIYKFGPFSFDVMNDMIKLSNNNLIEEFCISGYNIVPMMTKKGEIRVESIKNSLSQNELKRMEKIKEMFDDFSGKELEEKSLEYLGITHEDKEDLMGEPVEDLIEEL